MRLAALAEAPYAFSSTLADWSGVGDTEARWRGRLADVPFNVIARIDGEAVGMVSATAPRDGEVELISMWVAPRARGRGVGEALIGEAVTWAGLQAASQITLSVRSDNERAISLYARQGFVDDGPTVGVTGGAERRMVKQLGQ